MRSKSSRRWLQEHFSDAYVKQAKQANYRSRAVYKLQEVNDRETLFKAGMRVIDLGAAPGSWSQLVVKLIQPHGRVIALDKLPMEPIKGVEFIRGDFTQAVIVEALLQQLDGVLVDWVISDMAPNLTGIDSVDQPQSIELAEQAFTFAKKVLSPRGGFLTKVFEGEGTKTFVDQLRLHFKHVSIRKPKASRSRSSEIYVLAKNG